MSDLLIPGRCDEDRQNRQVVDNKVVSAEGIESAQKHKFNNMQGPRMAQKDMKSTVKQASGSQTDRKRIA
jgi:hypothetical protein